MKTINLLVNGSLIIAFVFMYFLIFHTVAMYFFRKTLLYRKIKKLYNYLFVYQNVVINGEIIDIEEYNCQITTIQDENHPFPASTFTHDDYLLLKKDNNEELKFEIKQEVFDSLEKELKDDVLIEVNNITSGFVIRKLRLLERKTISIIFRKKEYSKTLHFLSYSF